LDCVDNSLMDPHPRRSSTTTGLTRVVRRWYSAKFGLASLEVTGVNHLASVGWLRKHRATRLPQ